ncbi:hypothetical protein OH77DRAFT_495119 [Trametes cingulata]|nr:hypothetical protein OH77DRAFT_495119 [Trametes cingulata]
MPSMWHKMRQDEAIKKSSAGLDCKIIQKLYEDNPTDTDIRSITAICLSDVDLHPTERVSGGVIDSLLAAAKRNAEQYEENTDTSPTSPQSVVMWWIALLCKQLTGIAQNNPVPAPSWLYYELRRTFLPKADPATGSLSGVHDVWICDIISAAMSEGATRCYDQSEILRPHYASLRKLALMRLELEDRSLTPHSINNLAQAAASAASKVLYDSGCPRPASRSPSLLEVLELLSILLLCEKRLKSSKPKGDSDSLAPLITDALSNFQKTLAQWDSTNPFKWEDQWAFARLLRNLSDVAHLAGRRFLEDMWCFVHKLQFDNPSSGSEGHILPWFWADCEAMLQELLPAAGLEEDQSPSSAMMAHSSSPCLAISSGPQSLSSGAALVGSSGNKHTRSSEPVHEEETRILPGHYPESVHSDDGSAHCETRAISVNNPASEAWRVDQEPLELAPRR